MDCVSNISYFSFDYILISVNEKYAIKEIISGPKTCPGDFSFCCGLGYEASIGAVISILIGVMLVIGLSFLGACSKSFRRVFRQCQDDNIQ